MEVMMSHLHAGPAVAARSADAAEVSFLVRVWRIARRDSVYDLRHSRSRTVPSTLTPPWRTLSRGSMRRWRICWFTVRLPSTAFTLHVAVT